ncbi:MAG: tetratricopeptide repeat protein [Nitrospirota bacterium]
MNARRCRGLALAAALAWAATAVGAGPNDEDRAYALNREGMVAMSEARFEDAIAAFDRAAEVATDYAIIGRPLMYTPVFMSGWGSEKIGRTRQACRAYRDYLRIAVEHPGEPTKVDHAKAFTAANCQHPDPK